MKQRGRKPAAALEVFPRPHLIASSTPAESPPAPAHLGDEERQIWDGIVRQWRGTDASLALLTSGLESHMRARQCREVIAQDGMTVLGRDNEIKSHPLLGPERAAHRAFAQVLRQLNIKV
jgi:hypothetical protein